VFGLEVVGEWKVEGVGEWKCEESVEKVEGVWIGRCYSGCVKKVY